MTNTELKLLFNKMRKRGLSAVVTTMIMIALAIALVAIVWTVVNNLVSKELGSVNSCVDIFDKVKINKLYTCYDSKNEVLQFSISVGDVEIDSLLVSISFATSSKSFTIDDSGATDDNVAMYSGGGVVLPGKNSGLTYNYTGLGSAPDALEISPKVDDNQCGVSDSLFDFPACASLI